MNDRIQPLTVVADVEPLRAFFQEKLGFEEATYRPTDDGALVLFRYATCTIGFTTPKALPELPSGLTQNAVIVLEVPEASAVYDVMKRRAGDALGDLREAPWGSYFDAFPPGAGVMLRFITLTVGTED